MSTLAKTHYAPEEYLELERAAEFKSEYFNGEIYAMSGASRRHALIVTNLVADLGRQLKKLPATVYSSALRVKVNPTGLYTYPDVIAMCGEAQFSDEQKDTLINPNIIIEVLSESTKDYDRGGKFEQYRTLESFKEYVLVAQDKPHVEHFVRQPDNRWILTETNRMEDSIELSSIGCTLALTEIYDKVDLLK
ncbi:MAG TPA: Uma2 family endonuclease [Pyrinomonadaceae bacterium]|jgi:Uma2 family endonuclease